MILSPASRLAVDYSRDGGFVDSKIGCHLAVQFTSIDAVLNFLHLLSRQLCVWMGFAVRRSLLSSHVLHVVVVRPQKEMLRVAAWRIVAFVQNVKAIWDWPESYLVGYAMRAKHLVFGWTRADRSVPTFRSKTSPLKASICCGGAQPFLEPLCKRRRSVGQAIVSFAFSRAKLATSVCDLGWLDLKCRPTPITGGVNASASRTLGARSRAILTTPACHLGLYGLKRFTAACTITSHCRSDSSHSKNSRGIDVGPVLHCSKRRPKSEMVQPGQTAGLAKFPQRDYAVLYPGDERSVK